MNREVKELEFNNENCKCRRCGTDLSNVKATYDGEYIYCDNTCYIWSKNLKRIKVDNIDLDIVQLKKDCISYLENCLDEYDGKLKLDNLNIYYKKSEDEDFHDFVKVILPESNRMVELSIRLLGGDVFGDRVFTCAYYYKYEKECYMSSYKTVEAVYYKYDKYKSIIEKVVNEYVKEVRPDFKYRKIDAVRFN